MFSRIAMWLRKFDSKVFPESVAPELSEEQIAEIKKGIEIHRSLKNDAFKGFGKTIFAISSAGIGWIFVNIDKFQNDRGIKYIILFLSFR
jgi:hypothetical protein